MSSRAAQTARDLAHAFGSHKNSYAQFELHAQCDAEALELCEVGAPPEVAVPSARLGMTNREDASLVRVGVVRAARGEPEMPQLILQFTKRKDGGAVLRCIRADGSATWQRQDDNRAAFFPLHDLTHYAVETELSFGRGFYGLIADGWEIADTTGKGVRGPLSDEAIEVEYIVGSLGAERAGDSACTAKEFNDLATAFAKTRERPEPRPLTDAELDRVRSRMDELFTRWRALPSGAMLQLTFPF